MAPKWQPTSDNEVIVINEKVAKKKQTTLFKYKYVKKVMKDGIMVNVGAEVPDFVEQEQVKCNSGAGSHSNKLKLCIYPE